MRLPAASRAVAAFLLATLGACTTPAARDAAQPAWPSEADVRSDKTCGADRLDAWLGRQADDPAVAALRTWRGPDHPLRVIGPGMIATTDYRPDRLNLDVDAKGRILRVYCS